MNQGKNIWIINFFAGSPTSGWGERHYFLSKKWIKDGYEVSIISSTYNHMFNNYASEKNQYNHEIIDGRQFCWIRTPKYNPKSVSRFWAMILFAIKAFFVPVDKLGKPDIIIVSSMPIFPSLTGWLLKKKYNADKFIFEIRDIWPLTAQMLMGYSKYHPFILLLAVFEKIGYKKSDYIVSVLPNADKHINRISKSPEKFKYIPNGISDDILFNEPLPVEIRELIPKSKFIVGYTGTIGLANALEHLVDTAKYLVEYPQIHIVMVGDGYLKDELITKSKDLNNVTFIPKIKKSYMQSMISLFDVCFIGRNNTPLFNYGVSSNKYFDYMLASKPILVSSNRIKDPVELSGCGVIVEPDSAMAIKEGLIEMFLMSEDKRIELGKKGKQFVHKYHEINYLSNEYEKLF